MGRGKQRKIPVCGRCPACYRRRMQPSDIRTDTPMGIILEALPGARRALFARYHLGGCSSCAFSHDETLAELCARSGIDADEALAHLLASHRHDEEMWIDPAEVAGEPGRYRLIDIRTREEHEAVAIPDSELFTQDLQQHVFAGNPDAEIVLYDHGGKGVLDQVAWFRGHGLKSTFGLRGGIDAWSRGIDPSLPRYRIEVEV